MKCVNKRHKNTKYITYLLGIITCFIVNVHASDSAMSPEQNHGFTDKQISQKQWWNIPYPDRFDTSLLEKQSILSVHKNTVVNDQGELFVLKGVNIADIAKLTYDKRWNETLFSEIKAWGANVIRIPIHPIAWREKGKAWFFKEIDQAVLWANKHNMYLILDWHSIGNLYSQMYQHEMYITSPVETANFWRDIAFRYKNVPTIAVYELFNEPTHDFIGNGAGSLGKITWAQWRELQESIIDIVQVYDANVITLVAGFNWAYDLTEVIDNPIRRDNVAYAIHPYPQKAHVKDESIKNLQAVWQKQWGYVAERYPLMATELGWVKAGGKGAHIPVIHNGNTYGPAIIEFMQARHMSWTAWAFDPDWAPALIKDWQFTPTEQGVFFRQVLQEK